MRYGHRRPGNSRGRPSSRRGAEPFRMPHMPHGRRHHHHRGHGRFSLGCLIPILVALAVVVLVIVMAI